jgi:hypothetical protein
MYLLIYQAAQRCDAIAEPEDYLLDVILSGAYLCDVALNYVLCDNRRDFYVLGANKRQIVFGGLRRSANGCMWPISVSVTLSGAPL